MQLFVFWKGIEQQLTTHHKKSPHKSHLRTFSKKSGAAYSQGKCYCFSFILKKYLKCLKTCFFPPQCDRAIQTGIFLCMKPSFFCQKGKNQVKNPKSIYLTVRITNFPSRYVPTTCMTERRMQVSTESFPDCSSQVSGDPYSTKRVSWWG